eukprot:TCONS_00062052-protein
MWCDNRLLLFGVLLLTFLVQAHITAAANSKEDEFAEFDRDPDAQEEEDDTEADVEEVEQNSVNNDDFNDENEFDKGGKEEKSEDQQEHEEQDEFDPFTDEEEFEGYNKDRMPKAKVPAGGPGLKITKVPVHLRAGWQAFYLELVTLAGILVYAANFFTGKSKNSKLATAWFKAHKPLLEQHFSIVGDDGMSKEPQSGVLVKESESVYTLWCTGRQYCEGMLVELRLLKRHDLVSVMAQMMRPKSELIKVTVYMDDEDMDNFVFALLPKKQAAKYQKELQDLSYFCGDKKSAERFNLENHSVLSESGEVTDFILSQQVCNIIKKNEECFESLHFSDQFVGPKKDETEETEGSNKLKKPKKVLLFEFKIPGNGRTKVASMGATEQLVKMVLFFIDRVKSLRLGQQARSKSDKKRREVEQSFSKQSHAQRQEAAQMRREEKIRAEKERLMAEEDPEKQRKMEEQMTKRDAKKRNPKVKSLKVRM